MGFASTRRSELIPGAPGCDIRTRSAITFLRCGCCAERAPERVPDSLGCAYLRGGEVNVVLPDRAGRRSDHEHHTVANSVCRRILLRCRSCGFRRVVALKKLRPLLVAGYPTIHIGPRGQLEGVV